MYEIVTLTLAWLAGAILGAFFFGGLWWTIRKGLSSKHPALWFFISMLVRTSVVLAGFLVLARGHWQRKCPYTFSPLQHRGQPDAPSDLYVGL